MDSPPTFPPLLARWGPDFAQAMLDTAQGLICCMDTDGRIVVFNRACQKLMGYSEEEVRGRFLWEVVVPPDQAEDRRRRFALLKQGVVSGSFEATWITRGGEPRIISWQTAILRDDSGAIAGVVATGVDITQRREAERALSAEQTFFRALLDELPDGLVACDGDGVLKYMNRRTAEFHARPGERLPSEQWASHYSLYHPDGRLMQREEVPLFRALGGERVRDCELVINPPNARARFMLCAGDPLFDEAGRSIGAVVQMHDDTERRAAEQFLRQSEQRLREQNLQLECLFSLAKEFTRPVSSRQLGASLEAAAARIAQLLEAANCRIVLHRGGAQSTVHQASAAEGESRIEAPLAGGAGHLTVFDGPRRVWKESERRWIEAAADLIGNAIERARIVEDLATERERALEASQAKSRFLANMSHEIRTPLNGVLGLVQLLQRSPDMPERHLHSLGMVRDSGAHLLALVNDILDLSRIEAGRIDFQRSPVELRRLLDELAAVFHPSAAEKGLSLTLTLESCPPQVETDERRLRQVLLNLLGNAIKFTPSGAISLIVKEEDRDIRFEVSDTGAGIAPADLDRLFQPFERGAADHSAPGTGLGLAISSRLAEGLGGRIEASSQPDRGSRFTLVLPSTGGEAQPGLVVRIPEVAPTFPQPFLETLESAIRPHLDTGDIEGARHAIERLREAHTGDEEAFLRAAGQRAAAFDLAWLFEIANRIRGART